MSSNVLFCPKWPAKRCRACCLRLAGGDQAHQDVDAIIVAQTDHQLRFHRASRGLWKLRGGHGSVGVGIADVLMELFTSIMRNLGALRRLASKRAEKWKVFIG